MAFTFQMLLGGSVPVHRGSSSFVPKGAFSVFLSTLPLLW